MLHGAAAPPYWPAFPVHKFGSISLCGGARSNWAHPQNMSLGKNMRSSELRLKLTSDELVDCAAARGIRTEMARIHAHCFIVPPGSALLEFRSSPLTARGCRLISGSESVE